MALELNISPTQGIELNKQYVRVYAIELRKNTMRAYFGIFSSQEAQISNDTPPYIIDLQGPFDMNDTSANIWQQAYTLLKDNFPGGVDLL